MKTETDLTAPDHAQESPPTLISAPAVAEIAYTTASATGRAVWPSNLDVATSGA